MYKQITQFTYYSIAIVLFIIFSSISAKAQYVSWKAQADSSAVFEIDSKEAEFLMINKSDNSKIKKFINDLKKRHPKAIYANTWMKDTISKGHFIHASVVDNKINYNYEMIIPFQVFLFKEYGMLTLQIIDMDGKIRNDAKIKIKNRWSIFDDVIGFDKETQTYRIKDYSYKQERFMSIELDKFKVIFDLNKRIITPEWSGGGYGEDESTPDIYSYIITDKNKYRPHESVRFKSYALSGKKKPLKDKLEVWLQTGRNYNDFKKIKEIDPYHPGGYADEIFLHDSLKIKLDQSYSVHLRAKNGQIIANCSFKYEDYELFYTRMLAKVQNNIHYNPDTNKVEIQIVDANGLIIPDMKANILVRRRSVSKSFTDLLVIPDTIISERITLDNDAPTIFNIPPTLIKDANCSYDISVNALTHDGQPLNFYDNVIFYHEKYALSYTTHNDSMRIVFTDRGREMHGVKAQLSIIGNDVNKKEVSLPIDIPFVQALKGYNVYVSENNFFEQIYFSNLSNNLMLDGKFATDSFNVKLINPLQLDLTWYIYQGNTLINKGSGKEMEFLYPHTDLDKIHYVEIFYTIGGEDRVFRQIFTPKKEYLSIDVTLPDRVYPGQKVNTTITVKDSWGTPVKDVDLTAFAVNSQLNYYLPDLPYYGSEPQGREERDSYNINRRSNLYYTEPLIRWTYWNKLLGLDKQKYYQFTYPWYKTFTYTINTPDSVTQFAPYAMYRGSSIHPYVIEANGKPVYFSWTTQPKHYSFVVSDTLKYNISMRFADRIITIPNMKFEKGKKTIFSIDITHLPINASVQMINNLNYDKQDVFTSSEIERYKEFISDFPISKQQTFTALQVNDTTYPIYHLYLQNYSNYLLAGPLPNGKGRFAGGVEYKHENGFRYEFEDNVVYKYPLTESSFPKSLTYFKSPTLGTVNDFALTHNVFNDLIKGREKINRWYPSDIQIIQSDMQLKFVLPSNNKRFNPSADTTGVSNLLLIDCITGKIYYPNTLEYGRNKYSEIPVGKYNIVLVYNDGYYLERKNLDLRQNAYIELNMSNLPLNEATEASMAWRRLRPQTPPTRDYRPITTDRYIYNVNRSGKIGKVTGMVRDNTGEPLIGVSVMIKGTSFGTISDIDGRFSIDINESPVKLVFAYIGFKNEELLASSGSDITVTLQDDARLLEEVVVVGYGSVMKRSLTGSVSSVSGYSLMASEAPMEKMAAMEILEDSSEESKDKKNSKEEIKQAERQLYTELLQLSSGLRSNFSDVGFWQPKLYTDKKGKAEFEVTFPDNITSWNALVYAMNSKLKTGTWRKNIKSYKPLMAELAMPRFLVAGDSSNFATTIRNYTGDKEITGRVTFVLQQDTLLNKEINFANSFRDKTLVNAAASDSLTATYMFIRSDGYQDGEKRSIPVEAQGTEIAEGFLNILRNGDKYTVEAKDGEEIDISINARQLDVYMDATNYLTGYKYACNEQLASKLMGLLNYKLYKKFMEEDFKHDKQVDEIIKRLVENRTNRKLWSWWGNSPSQISFWMSAHIMKALRMARDAGYEVDIDMRYTFQDYTDVKNYRNISLNDIRILQSLSDWGTEQNYEESANRIEKVIRRYEQYEDSVFKSRKEKKQTYYKRSYLKEKLSLWSIRQKQNAGYVSDSVKHYLKKDVLGGMYCTDGLRPYYWYDDELSATLLAYEIVKNDSTLSDLKENIQMYVLASKRRGWNTYQASSAVSAILPDLLGENTTKNQQATVMLSGKDIGEISKFPYTQQLKSGERLYIEKKDGLPLFFTQSTLTRVAEERKGDAFEISTEINGGRNFLIEGKTASMKVTVKVKQRNAEHIMIEVPIPAGCSYASKTQSGYWGREAHREYFKEKTVIFCESLPEGEYTFYISLLPRYTGRYIVNPAKVEMMYFPVVNANNDMTKISIIE